MTRDEAYWQGFKKGGWLDLQPAAVYFKMAFTAMASLLANTLEVYSALQVWNQDLPHVRAQCGKHFFVQPTNPSNQEHCSKVTRNALSCPTWPAAMQSSTAFLQQLCNVLSSFISKFLHMCLQCFCYVCDVEADKCQLWGSGEQPLPRPSGHDSSMQ